MPKEKGGRCTTRILVCWIRGDDMSSFENVMLEKLDQIVERLNVLIELSIPEFHIEGLKLGSVEKTVLRLCDLKHTRKEIAKKTRKTENQIDVTLNSLRRKKLIKSLKIGNKTFYVRTRIGTASEKNSKNESSG